MHGDVACEIWRTFADGDSAVDGSCARPVPGVDGQDETLPHAVGQGTNLRVAVEHAAPTRKNSDHVR